MRGEVVVITCSRVFSLIYAASITLKVGTSIHKGGGNMILMVTIRRAALDEFWSREPVIIRGNLTMGKQLRRVAIEEMGLE